MDEQDKCNTTDNDCGHSDCIALRVLGANFAAVLRDIPIFPLMLGVVMTVRECSYSEGVLRMLDYFHAKVLDEQLDADIAETDIDAEIAKLLSEGG